MKSLELSLMFEIAKQCGLCQSFIGRIILSSFRRANKVSHLYVQFNIFISSPFLLIFEFIDWIM